MGSTSIEWCDHTINPIKFRLKLAQAVEGVLTPMAEPVLVNMCTKCSPACTHCYAEAMTRRWWPKEAGTFPGYTLKALERGEFVIDESKLEEVLRRRKPTRYFWCDMTDLFHPSVPFELVNQCLATMILSPQHTHLLLTKRPDRMAEYLLDYRSALGMKTDELAWKLAACRDGERLSRLYRPRINDVGVWPPRNVWHGTTVENQECADDRIPHLLRCPAAIRFLSCEPLLGPIDLDLSYDGPEFARRIRRVDPCANRRGEGVIDWVIAGGESGAGARSMHPDWARSLRDQCQAAGVAFFFKQWGSWYPDDRGWGGYQNQRKLDGGVVMTNYGGKRAAGRLLDGREWNELPVAAGVEVQ